MSSSKFASTLPVPTRRRGFVEGMIRIVDLIVYAAIAIGGLYAVMATPTSVEAELGQDSLLIWLWAGLLTIGGTAGFLGRLARRWMVEAPATILAMAGTLIYVIILGRLALTSITATVAVIFAATATALMFRRWSELQLFATTGKDAKSAWLAALNRKTADFARHS